MKTLSRIYNTLIFAFLYAPIVVLVIFSFNDSKSRSIWNGFSLRWYEALFYDEEIREALGVTLQVAILSALFATVIGVLAAVGIHALNKKLRKVFLTVNNLPMVNPEIVTGISLMLLFVFIYQTTGLLRTGFLTLLIAHITFNIPYVILQVMPKLRQMNQHMYEAALDLGCHPTRAFFKVVMPEIMPGVTTGALMAFTMSLDDFVISYFTSGSTAQTLSVTIYNMTKRPITPEINALSTLMFGTILLLLLAVNIYQIRDDAKKKRTV
ncbi:MAG: ABC transporter permease [Clostridia bacterium]|nr:ABC transporter permease [Clostridia bacterium]MBQ7302418.1 ABC transporter permease [Clostridia bacterium]